MLEFRNTVTVVPTRGIKSDTTGDQASDNRGHVALLTQRHAREYCLSHKSNETSLGGQAPVKGEQGYMLRSTGIDAENGLGDKSGSCSISKLRKPVNTCELLYEEGKGLGRDGACAFWLTKEVEHVGRTESDTGAVR